MNSLRSGALGEIVEDRIENILGSNISDEILKEIPVVKQIKAVVSAGLSVNRTQVICQSRRVNMICPKCTFEQLDGSEQCLRCGVIFAKLHSVRPEYACEPTNISTRGEIIGNDSLTGSFKDLSQKESPILLVGRLFVWVVLLVWGGKFMLTPISGEAFSESYMHLVNLPFHEAGHVIFSPFGRFIQVLGGTLGQWLVPLAVMVSFLFKADRFAASVGLWWLGQSFMDIAPYMDDARAGQLMLLGGVTGSEVEDYHDWEIILTRLGLMQYDHVIARISFGCGVLLMLAALIWGGWALYCQNEVRKQTLASNHF